MQGLINDIEYCQDRARPTPISSQEFGETVLTAPKNQPPQPTTRMLLPDQSVKFRSHWNRLQDNQQRSSAAPNSDQHTTDLETPATFSLDSDIPAYHSSHHAHHRAHLFHTKGHCIRHPSKPSCPHLHHPAAGAALSRVPAWFHRRYEPCALPLCRYRAAGNDAAPASAKRPTMLSLSGKSYAPLSGSIGGKGGWASIGHGSPSMLSWPVEQAGNWNIEFDAPARFFQYVGDSRLLALPSHPPDMPAHISPHVPPLYAPAAHITSHASKRSRLAATHPCHRYRHRHDLDDPLISLHGRREGSPAGPTLSSPVITQLTHVNHSDPSLFTSLSAGPSAGRTAGRELSPAKGDVADGGEKGGEERKGREEKAGREAEEGGDAQGKSWYLTGFPAHATVDTLALLPTRAHPIHAHAHAHTHAHARTHTAASRIPTHCSDSGTHDSTHGERAMSSPDAREDERCGHDDVNDDDAAAARQLARELECAARAREADDGDGDGDGERASWDTAAFRAAFEGA